jgi:predicted GIY-YIG superfamily endonuclease
MMAELSHELLTLDDIATMHHCTVRHARDVLVKLDGFPQAKPGLHSRWSRQEVWNFIHRKPLDAPGEHCLYRHFDASGALLYIGISLSAVERLSAHNRTARWSAKITRVEIERFATRDEAVRAESSGIKDEKPRYNKQHNGSNT